MFDVDRCKYAMVQARGQEDYLRSSILNGHKQDEFAFVETREKNVAVMET